MFGAQITSTQMDPTALYRFLHAFQSNTEFKSIPNSNVHGNDIAHSLRLGLSLVVGIYEDEMKNNSKKAKNRRRMMM